MSSPRVSIALCTRNGERFLKDLLDSLAVQTQPPAEVVASDDASEDTSRHILEEFARQAGFPVKICSNTTALGVARNFECAISLCNGDIIALADQDDVWHPDKLARLTAALAPPDVQAVFSDAEVVDAELAPLGYSIWQSIRFTRVEQRRLAQGEAFAVLLKHYVVTGATLGFKSNLRDTALPILGGWPHDGWLALVGATQGRLVALPESLIAYRQHAGNVVGGLRKSLAKEASAAFSLDRIDWYREELTRWRALEKRLSVLHVTKELDLLAEKISHLEARASLPVARWKRLPGVFREVVSGRYLRYARNWGSVALDLLAR